MTSGHISFLLGRHSSTIGASGVQTLAVFVGRIALQRYAAQILGEIEAVSTSTVRVLLTAEKAAQKSTV